ncbi:MAG: phytoene/squalene synthase family protein [Chitinophagaceae bacterium]
MMSNLELYDDVSNTTSRLITHKYSTSFTLGIKMMNKKFHQPIYSIYGFVRIADEIVDTFHQHNKEKLLAEFKLSTYNAIEQGISLNPVLHSFQQVVNQYKIGVDLIDPFFKSMEIDLTKIEHSKASYDEYILGSAEVVGLMCLKVFCQQNEALYEQLKPAAMKLGSAFQKINFLRDISADYEQLGRSYFPDVDIMKMTNQQKIEIEADIEVDFKNGLNGIKKLPFGARAGVYIAYTYYYSLFNKIKATPPAVLIKQRIRISDSMKYILLIKTYLRHYFNLI